MALHKSEKKFFELIGQRSVELGIKPVLEQTIEEHRALTRMTLDYVGESMCDDVVNDFVVVRDGYKVPIRIYNASKKEGSVLVMYPGCGYITGYFEGNAIACSRIAAYSDIKVVVVDFRLAPEFQFPQSIYDAYDVTKYIAQHADVFGINKDRIFIGGLSSGAHCAAVVSGMAIDDDELSIHHQILLNGIYDLAQTHDEYEAYSSQDQFCTADVVEFILDKWNLTPEKVRDPVFSPYYLEDMQRLPATTIMVGEYDGLRSYSEVYYLKLKAAGCEVEKILLKGQTHNTILFQAMMEEGKDPARDIADVILERL